VPISTLYPANQTLYRRLGYEQAGHRFEVRIPMQRISARVAMRTRDGLTLREARSEGTAATRVRELSAQFAAACQGSLDRNELLWKRIELPPPNRTEPARLFLIERGRALEAYVYLTQVTQPTGAGAGRYDVFVQDMAAITPAATDRLWAFLAGYSTVGNDLVWMTGPTNPLLLALPEQTYKPMTLRDHWMLRLVNPKPALELRGWPAGLSAKLTLEVSDDLLRANTGRWSLSVADGQARVRKLDRAIKPRGPLIKCDIGALATLYAGFQSAGQLAMVGRIQGSADSIELASSVLASTRGVPMLTDMF
jgi:predicted acetyltransferase